LGIQFHLYSVWGEIDSLMRTGARAESSKRSEQLVFAEQLFPVLDKADQHHNRRSRETDEKHGFHDPHDKSNQVHTVNSTSLSRKTRDGESGCVDAQVDLDTGDANLMTGESDEG
jgi:hypothetical protein